MFKSLVDSCLASSTYRHQIVDLVFFTVIDGCHFFRMVFDLRRIKIHIIDNIVREDNSTERYKDVSDPLVLKKIYDIQQMHNMADYLRATKLPCSIASTTKAHNWLIFPGNKTKLHKLWGVPNAAHGNFQRFYFT